MHRIFDDIYRKIYNESELLRAEAFKTAGYTLCSGLGIYYINMLAVERILIFRLTIVEILLILILLAGIGFINLAYKIVRRIENSEAKYQIKRRAT